MNRTWSAELDWKRCEDGVELFDYGPEDPGRSDFGQLSGKWYRARSDNFKPLHFRLDNLEDTLVVRFINAKTEEKCCNFLTRFGMPADLPAGPEKLLHETPNAIQEMQQGLRRMLSDDSELLMRKLNINKALSSRSRPLFRPALDVSGGSGRLMLRCESLFGYMLAELIMATAAEAVLKTCEHCNDAILVGHMTDRRETSKYCKDACRVAAFRARTMS